MNIYKIAIAAFLHDIGKFAERAGAAFNVSPDFISGNMDLYQPHFQEQYTHKHALYTAAFIDHIEKLLPREFNRDEWGLGDSFINLAAGHHKPETPLQWVIAMADRVSSGFDRDEFENYNKEKSDKGIAFRDYKKTRLLTIFEGISPDGNWKEDNLESYRFRYPLRELSPENIFPVDDPEYRKLDGEQASKEYEELFFNFIASLEKLEHRRNIPLWFEHFDSLFMIYASHIPAATVGKVVPDVSLYDHSRTTAALASAIYLYHLHSNSLEVGKITDYDNKKFLIVTGDFYGIQNFIFSEGGSTNKASAKLLRGRSFAVSLLSELAADMLCRQIGLTFISVVLNAAGKFTVIAPNTEKTKDGIKGVEDKINDWLVSRFFGESAFGLSYVEASCNDFTSKKFGELLERLAKTSEEKKFNKIDLEKYGGAVHGYLDRFNNNLSSKLCPFCHKRPSSPEAENDKLLSDKGSACKVCRDHIYIGTRLVRTSRIAVTTIDAEIPGPKLLDPLFGDYQVSLNVDGKLDKLAEKGVLLKYWDISLPQNGRIAKDITAKFVNGYVPKYEQEDNHDERLLVGPKREETIMELIEAVRPGEETPKTFLHIAKKALNHTDKPGRFTGIEALGILKADVDNLGLVFACGLRHNSLSRLATLSRQMNHFFCIFLPYALSTKDEFRDIYTIFAGGDDLFLVGPWNRIVDFSSYLNSSFRSYVCGNDQVTISAGMSVNRPGEPVPSIADKSEAALGKSKRNGRDSVTLFGEPVKWAQFQELNGVKEAIEAWMDRPIINNAMLFRLNAFSNLAKQEKYLLSLKEGIDIEEWNCLKWRATFKYTLARNVGKNLKGNERTEAMKEVEKAVDWFAQYGGAMKIPVWQVIYNRR
ncbi:MAG: type III-A CRISPR-associated protein Cas10/Csm1 [Thermodesulfobacteriota bacterium]|nr:type III-A CRISPR-associated protein Cas10/Csm1 [Thermodesulfobacteriota bacterium]